MLIKRNDKENVRFDYSVNMFTTIHVCVIDY